VGKQRWKGGSYETSLYYAGNSTEYLVLNIYSELYNNVTIPDGEAFGRGTTIQIRGDIRDDCGLLPGIPTQNIEFKIIEGANEYSTASITDLNNGTYATSWDSGQAALLGWHNITMNSSWDYYNSSFIEKVNAFYLGERPELVKADVTPKQEGWGYNFTFNVSFRDLEGDVVNISLWKAYSPSGPWYFIKSKNVTSTIWKNISFYHVFDCNDYLTSSTIYFKFNASDSHGLKNESSVSSLTL